MREIRSTLVTDGPSDVALIPILRWLLQRQGVCHAVLLRWADTRRPIKPLQGLVRKIEYSLEAYPCDLLFIHRDAEKEPAENRRKEIVTAITSLSRKVDVPQVCVIPVRMTEAWLLFQERALRHASGNPNGEISLDLPRIADLEDLPNPKETLHDLLERASELKGRRLKSFSAKERARRIADFLDDFSPLRALPAFSTLESDIGRVVREQKWDQGP